MSADELRRWLGNQTVLPFVYCYPPRTSYVEEEAPLDLRVVWERDSKHVTDLNIYIHIPFCRYKCSFCNLYTITTATADTDFFRSYVNTVLKELEYLAPSLSGRRIRSVFIGGGTPFYIGVDLLIELLNGLKNAFPDLLATAEEISVEGSPDSILAVHDQLATLVSAGVNRVSVGAQSFDAVELALAGRNRAGPNVIWDSLHQLRSAGVKNIGVDLIVGLQGQTYASVMRSVDKLLDFLPETISVYPVSPRRGTSLGRTLASLPLDNREIFKRLAAVSQRLQQANYVRETSVQFKLPGRGGLLQKRLYFEGISVLGLGSGARSYTATVDYLTGGGPPGNRAALARYLQRKFGETKATSGISITAEEAERRSIILRLHDIDIDRLPRNADHTIKEPYSTVLNTCMEHGLMEQIDRKIKLTEKGYLHREIICWSLFSEEVLNRHSTRAVEYSDTQRFVSGA